MFKITKFVIAAALTAIIAAPVMAQKVDCPCWTPVDVHTAGDRGTTLCKTPYETYIAILENEHETLVVYAENSKQYCDYEGDILPEEPVELKPGEAALCINLLKNECFRQGINPFH